MITKTKVLIIKLGYSETLDQIISKECSLGDVVRTTVLLNYFRDNDNITWLCDEHAEPLLEGNPYIDRVLTWDFETALQLTREKFDVVINLEKGPAICALSDNIDAWQKYGFRFSDWQGKAEAHYNTEKVLEISQSPLKRDKNTKYWQEHIAKVINRHWSIKDTYVMKDRKQEIMHEYGLNWRVGKKWPEKEWGEYNWQVLGEELRKLNKESKTQAVCRQPELGLMEYMDWIASCRNIITCDSLGMHLAIAYGRNVIALFGPTNAQEVFFYDKGRAVVSKDGKMSSITIGDVLKEIQA